MPKKNKISIHTTHLRVTLEMTSLAALPTRYPFISSRPLRPKPQSLKTLTLSATTATAVSGSGAAHHGPSLRRGRPPPPPLPPAPSSGSGAAAIERERFTRAFDLAALRVPPDVCAALEGRLRGHLLNWPRVRNVARVAGDDVEPGIKGLLRPEGGDGGQRLVSLAKRAGEVEPPEVAPLSPVLYREKLAREFNCRGFLNFPNLAKISRPKVKKKSGGRGGDGEGVGRRGVGKNDFAIVEVVGEERDEGLARLLGDDFQWGSWRGPTRLLLLDERYADKGVDELPEAVKVAVVLL